MDAARRAQIGDMYTQQRQRAATYKPQIPEIPRTHGCAGPCSQPPPPPPVSNTRESFFGAADTEERMRVWWVMIGGASVVFALLCMRRR
jgi:hypothetical protein